MYVLGREGADGPVAEVGTYRAADGSDGARVGMDLDRPHVGLVVGKRGHGKSYTLGVLAEEAARAPGVAPVVVDPMGVFAGLAAEASENADADARTPVPARVVESPTVAAGAVAPSAWPDLFDLSPTDPAGALLWEAGDRAATLPAMRDHVADAAAADAVRRAASNHLSLAASWGVFDPDGLDARDLLRGEAVVLDCHGLADRAASVLVGVVARSLYDACVAGRAPRLPWLLVDEAHAFFEGVSASALETVSTRGRAPGVSLVVATQRPSALPPVAVSQADVMVAHRLTAESDVAALSAATPTYLEGSLHDRLPARPGEAVVVDDATESVHGVRIRRRETPHGGADPRASDRAGS